MGKPLRPNPYFDALEDEHRAWLAGFDRQYLRNWEKLLGVDEEAALAEAWVRRLLQKYTISVEPNEDLSGVNAQPDFRCFSGDNKFYVEVTCIPIDVAVEATGIPETPHGFTPCQPLTDAVFAKCRGKASQCSNLDAPALVLIGTFHIHAARHTINKPIMNWVLTGEAKLAWDFDMATGTQVGDAYQTTEFHSAAFLRPDDAQEVGYARSSISGLALCSLGSEPIRILGVLHPNPTRPFDPALLPDVEFGQVTIDRSTRQLHVNWPQGTEE